MITEKSLKRVCPDETFFGCLLARRRGRHQLKGRTGMARLVVKNLTKTYAPGVTPVRDISFNVEEREFLTLLGPSGCGKSTILRMIAGLEVPTSGDIFVGDQRVNDLHPSLRDMAMVFQSYALYPHMTVFENIAINLSLKRVPRREIQQRVEEVARLLDIAHLLDCRPKALSGGQRQRVALGRAIVRKPRVFLLDEPLSNLDAILRERMRLELKALFASLDATVVYVTHDQTEAVTMSSKIAVLHDARIQQIGAPDEIYDRPNNVFVANFVGSPRINILRATVEREGLIAIGKQKVPSPGRRLREGAEVLLGVRPEHVRVGEGNLDAEVRFVEPMGAFNLLRLTLDGLPVDAIVDPRAHFTAKVRIGFVPERMHFFDAKSERRM
jgi:multiple sugar transport system ATP-binding protein